MHHIQLLERRFLLATYYVDLQGSDANPGTDPSTPFASIAKINTLDLLAGDSVLFDAADAFAGTLLLDTRDVGTPAQPITISSFGQGRATINAGGADGISALNTAAIVIQNLRILGSGQSPQSASGIEFDNNLPGNVKLPFVRIADVEVGGFGKYGITLGGSSGKSGFADVRIERADVYNNLVGGIETHGVFSSSATTYANSNVYVGHSTVHHNPGYAGSPNHSGNGIVLSDADGVVIERNVAFENGAANTHVGGPVGIWVWDVNNAIIQNNESHHNKTNSTADGGGFDLDGGVTNSIVQYNYSHDNAGPGYGIFQFQGARPFRNNTLRYNISQNDARKNSYGAISFWNGNGGNGINGVDVYNNTIFISPAPTGTPKALQFMTGTTNVRIRNNIFQTTGGLMIAEIPAKHTGLVFQGNDYWSSGAAFKLKSFAKTYSSVAAWSKSTGYETLNGQTVGLQLDPGLNAPGAAGTIGNADLLETSLDAYKLRPDSPLINRGLNLFSRFGINPGPRDFFGTPLPTTSDYLYDIGAHEYA
jgi:hypothetical protein